MPNVQLPDNSVVAFPDTMAEADINSAIGMHMQDSSVQDSDNAPDHGALNAMSNSAADMATFGLSTPFNALGMGGIDYAADKARSAMGMEQKHPGEGFGDYYDRVKKALNNEQEIAADQHPIADVAGKALGFFGGMGAGVPLGGVKTGSSVAASTQPLLKSTVAQTLLKNSAVNGSMGATVAGLDALGNAEGSAGDRLEAASNAALTGGVIGAATPPVVQAGASVLGKVAGPIASRFLTDHDELTLKKISQAFGRDDLDPAQIKQSLSELGPEASIADAAGANTQGLGRAVAGMPGNAKESITNFLDKRQAAQGARVEEATAQGLLGGKRSYYDAEQALVDQQKLANPLYQEAYKENQSVNSPVINKILRTPAGKKALNEAAVKMQNDMTLVGVPDAELAEQAKLVGTYKKGGIASGLKMRTLDYVKQALDDQIGSSLSVGEKGNARIFQGQKKALVSEMDNLDSTAIRNAQGEIISPGKYAQARSAFAGPAQARDALESGRKFMLDDSELTNRALNDMSDGEKEMFRIGAARALRDKIYSTPYTADSVKNVYGSPTDLFGSAAKRERLQTVFPSKEAFNDFEKSMSAEAKMYATRANVTQGSRTTPMAEEIKDSATDAGHLLELAKGNWKGAAIKFGMNTLNKLQMPEPVRDMIAEKLFSNDPVQNVQTLHSLEALINAQKPAISGVKMSPMLSAHGGHLAGALMAQ